MPAISVSIVSHAQGQLLLPLLADLDRHFTTYPLEVLLTLNLPEEIPFDTDSFRFPVIVHVNTVPAGFSENHDHAFARSSGQYFCVMNPDVRLNEDPFPALVSCLQDTAVGVVAPVVLNAAGEIEDSARFFPTPLKIVCKALGGCRGSDYVVKDKIVLPDWVAGMFMLFRRETFEELGGFDQRYFLYYEDVDLCARLRLQSYEVALCPDARVIHYAHRSSHRDLRYMAWHLSSMLQFFFSVPFLKICWMRCTRRFS